MPDLKKLKEDERILNQMTGLAQLGDLSPPRGTVFSEMYLSDKQRKRIKRKVKREIKNGDAFERMMAVKITDPEYQDCSLPI